MAEPKYTKEELAVLQVFVDQFRKESEEGTSILFLFTETEMVEACKTLVEKRLAKTSPPTLDRHGSWFFKPDPIGSIWIEPNEAGVVETFRLFKAKILTRYEDRPTQSATTTA